ncbi:MAG TPA: hypothetical protein PLT67_10675, partial [Kiritimatiellia bacterium]|nr:hypothetical protein [Kiritimatiellia bacterium]
TTANGPEQAHELTLLPKNGSVKKKWATGSGGGRKGAETQAKSSNHWKFLPGKFQSLEVFPEKVPGIGTF